MNKEARICGICLGKLSIFNVYVPNGNPTEITEKYEFKLQWLDELSKMVELYISNYQDIIVAGDFNVLEHKNDVKDFENWNLDALGKIETRKLFRKILHFYYNIKALDAILSHRSFTLYYPNKDLTYNTTF